MLFVFQFGASVGIAVATACLLGYFWTPRPLPLPTTGERGARRVLALEGNGWLRRLDLLVRHMAVRIADWPLGALKKRLNDWLRGAGWPFGWDADELIVWAFLISGAGAFFGGVVAAAQGHLTLGIIVGGALGIVALRSKVNEIGQRRLVVACRNLPGAIDLIALAMRAGLDFSGSLERVTAGMSNADPLRFELEHVLHKLSLGWGRRDALASLAARIPDESLQSFIGAVIQADRRGNPLAEVLSTQAQVLRLRRSQEAEEAAARAGVLILGPLMLIFVCVFLILLGPFAVRALRGEIL